MSSAVQRKAMNWPPRVELATAVQFRRRFWRRLDATPAAGQRAQGGSEPNDAPKPPNQAFYQWKDHPGGWVIVVVRLSKPMGFFVEVRCIETDETLEFADYSTITYYRFDNEPIRVPQGPAWCYDCNRIQMAEVFPQYIAMRELDIEAARRDPNSEIAFILGLSDEIEHRALELKELKEYLQNRTTGPKCLSCFSERIQIIPDHGDVLLPDGNHYAISNCGFADFAIGTELELDNNGNKIRRNMR